MDGRRQTHCVSRTSKYSGRVGVYNYMSFSDRMLWIGGGLPIRFDFSIGVLYGKLRGIMN